MYSYRAHRLGLLGLLVICVLCLEILSIVPAFADSSPTPFTALSPRQMTVNSWSGSSATLRMLGGLFLCLGVFAVIVRFLRRHAAGNPVSSRRISVRERIALSSKASLTLVSIDSCEFLVAIGGDSISIIPTKTGRSELFAASLEEADAREVFNA